MHRLTFETVIDVTFDVDTATPEQIQSLFDQLTANIHVEAEKKGIDPSKAYKLLHWSNPANLFELMPPHKYRCDEIPEYEVDSKWPHNEEFASMESGDGMYPYTGPERVAMDIEEDWDEEDDESESDFESYFQYE